MYRCGIHAVLAACVAAATGPAIQAPVLPDIDGFEKRSPARSFGRENLFDYINGAADAYLWYCFQHLTAQQYERGEEQVTVEAYRHCDAANGYGIYCSERPSAPRLAEIGTQGYTQKDFCAFVKGPWYVRLQAYRLGNASAEILKQIAGTVAAALPVGAGTATLHGAFPVDNRIAFSEKFFPADYLGHSFLKRVYAQGYRIAGTEVEAFVLEATSVKDAAAALSRWCQTRAVAMPARGQFARFSEPYGGDVVVVQSRTFLIGIVGKADRTDTEKIIGTIEKNLSARAR